MPLESVATITAMFDPTVFFITSFISLTSKYVMVSAKHAKRVLDKFKSVVLPKIFGGSEILGRDLVHVQLDNREDAGVIDVWKTILSKAKRTK